MTPQQLLDRILRLFPGFSKSWHSDQNLYISDRGEFTCSGVFAQLTSYYRDDCYSWSPTALEDLASLLEDCLMSLRSDEGTAAATCFLENIAGDKEEECIFSYLGPRSHTFMKTWKGK